MAPKKRVYRAPNPLATYETYSEGLPRVADTSPSSGIESAAIAYATPVVKGISKDSGLEYRGGYRKGNMTYAYVRQTDDGTPRAFAVANIAWKDDRVVAFGQSFEPKPKTVASKKPTVDFAAAILRAEREADGNHNGHPPELEYLMKPDGHLALVHVIQVQDDDAGTWHEVFIDAHSEQLLALNDFSSHATYTVLPIPGDAMPPKGFKTLTDPADTTASPSGWHTIRTESTTDTAGNNCIAVKDKDEDSTTEQSSATLNFNYVFDASEEPTYTTNLNAARVNAFYVANTFHDFTYRYGFTEDAFNFQEYNFNRGGKEGDRVMISVQEGKKRNNSFFHSPADGQSGVCHLWLYNLTKPMRDSAFDNSIIIHELTHGLTHRMIGGGTARSLATAEACGLGEGWSDAMADWVSQTSAPIKDYFHAVYATGNANGNREAPYSTSKDKNLLSYFCVEGSIEKGEEKIHDVGQIWANILHNVHAALVEKHGFSSSAMTNPDGTEGNIMFLHLFIDALALMPAQPTFVFARDAWIQADANRYNGANQTLLWNVFASRGLGFDAKDYEESTVVPSSKAIIVERGQTKLPPLVGGWDGGVAYGHIVSISVNPQTVVTISGIMTAGYRQKVKAELLDTLSLKSQTSVFFDGEASREALLIDNTSEKALIWGPFDNQMTVELTFYNISSSGHGWTISIIEADKIAELLANNLKTAMTVIQAFQWIPTGEFNEEYNHITTLTVSRVAT